jgi:hypothetical protein
VSEQIWYRHDGLDTVVKQPRDARAQLAQSGWFPLPEKDVAARDQAAVDAIDADEKAMQAQVAKSAEATAAAERAALAGAEKALAPPDDETPTKAPPRGKTPTKGND